MSRSVELGRAVLHAPITNHELWLTTFITISPEQTSTYLAQLTPVQCLEELASGALWVHRGHDMHMDLKLTLHNEALPHKQFQALTNAILQAPIWHQLMLRPSLASNFATESGTMRLIISHTAVTGKETEKKRHRLFSDVPAADIQPPDGVMSVSLQSIRLCMDISETSPRRRLVVTRSNHSPEEHGTPSFKSEDMTTNHFDMNSVEDTLNRNVSRPAVLVANRKRKRRIMGTSPTTLKTSDRAAASRERDRKILTKPQLQDSLFSTVQSQADVLAMVDSALRLSIRGTINKYPHGLKVKASTFHLGLADVAPILWRSGYLDALSHRAQLMPTIAQSLAQTGFQRATTASLKFKMQSISNTAYVGQQDTGNESKCITESTYAQIKSSIASHLWIHSQKYLCRDPIPAVLACVGSHPGQVDSGSEDMLAENSTESTDPIHGIHEEWVLDKLTEIISDGCAIPPISRAVTGDEYQDPTHQQPLVKSTPGHGLTEIDEELLFDPLPH